MNKQAFLEETYNSAFEDELEKISGKNLGKVKDIASKMVRNFGVPMDKEVKKKGISKIVENIKKFKRLNK